jgi:hypothetical protein
MQYPSTQASTVLKRQTARDYYSPLMSVQTSQPLLQLGFPNPVPIARRRVQTTGWIDGSMVAMSEYPFNGRRVIDTRPIEYRGY